MFVDTAKVKITAGNGGNGAISFRHEIYIPKGGPDGGDGGKGGDIIFRASRNQNTLANFRFQPELKAEHGRAGSGQRSTGRSGADLIVEVPVGTVVWQLNSDGSERAVSGGDREGVPIGDLSEMGRETVDRTRNTRTKVADLTTDGQEAIVAHGGTGGFGNAHFKSSVRQTPRIAEHGELGEAFDGLLELKSIADIGLLGLPNAGKSTFLSVVSNARPEIADYPFTTLTPSLGVATVDGTDLLIADIPGLIEGASEGKGLGTDFLRHIERTSVLLHLIDAYSEDAGVAYATIRTELEHYSPDLATRPEIIALTKTEGMDTDLITLQTASIRTINPKARIYPISAQSHQGIKELLRALKKEIATTSSVKSSVGQNPQTIGLGGVSKRGVHTPTSSPGAVPATREDGLAHETSAKSDGLRVLHQDALSDLPVIKLKPRKKRPKHDLIDTSYEDDKKLRKHH